MPDKVSPSQFAKSVKEKYPEYKSYDDVKLSQAIIEKYPEYKDIVDFGIKEPSQAPIQPIQPVPTSKYQKAVDDDRSEIGKTIATIYNGIVGSLERLAGGGAELFMRAASTIPTPQYNVSGAYMPQTPKPVGVAELPKEQQIEARKQLRAKVEKTFEPLKSRYVSREEERAMQQKFDVTNGIGFDDLQGLAAMSGGMAADMALGAATGGATFVIQGYDDAVKDYDEAAKKMGVQENENARMLYGLAGGTINGLLEKFAIDKLVGGGPVFKSIQKKAIANVLKNTANVTGKRAIDAIEEAAVAEIKKLTSDIRSKGMRAGYRAIVEGGTESLQAALEDGAKFAINNVQGNEVFNENEIKDGFFKNVINSGVAGAIYGPVMGYGADKIIGRNVNTELLQDIANAKTDEDLATINDELSKAFDENNFSEQERQMVLDNAKRYNQIKQTLPRDTPPSVQVVAIPLIEKRIKLDDEINSRKQELEKLDESLRSEEQSSISLLEDKRSQINDDIKETVTGQQFNYLEKDGRYFKKLGDNTPEEISKNRYDLQTLKQEDNAATKGQRPIQESPTEGDISQYQGAQGEQEQASAKTDSRYRNIVSEEAVGIPSFLGMTVTYKLPNRKITGTLIQEGQTISVEDENGDVVAEIGNIDELSKMSPEQMNLTVIEPNVEITEKGFAVDGKELLNENENPFDAVSIDKNGNVMNVVLTTSAGKRRKFRGRVAQKLATQISQKEDQRLKAEDEQLQKKFAVTPPKAPVVITTQPTIAKVTEENIGEIDNIQATPLQKKVFNDVKNVVKAVGAAVKNITGSSVSVNIHDTKSYTDAVIEAGGTQEDAASRGFYMADDGSMHLNYDTLASDTMLHEGFHPILDILEKYNPQVINDLFTQLESIPEAADIISQAKEKYDGDITQKKEAITDFVAGVADGRIVLNPSNFQKIKKFILDMLNKIGIGGGGSELMNVNSEQDLVRLAKFVTEKFTTGEQITLESLDLIVGKKQYDSGDGIDIDEVIPEEGSGRGPQFSKETIEAAKKNLKSPSSLKGTKISRVVFYDLTRVGKLDIKNIKTGYTPNVEGKGGPLYSYMPSSIKDKAVLAFTSINQAIQSLQRQILYPNGTHAIAAQNPQTSHLGNKSTLSALFGDGIGIFQEAAKSKAQENEIVKVLVNEIDRISKMPQGEASKSVKKILKTVDLKSIKTLNDFRDKILLGAGNSFGSRGSIFAEIFQNKQTKITASTRESHKILHYKYGIPTIADIAQGNNQKELSSAELGDVMKLVRPNTEPVIYTTSKEQFDKYSNNPTPEMKKSGIRIELLPEDSAHESYPFVLAGENVALLDNFISAAQLFDKFSNLPKSKSFFSVGRMKKFAEAGEIPQSVMEEQGGPQFQKAPTEPISKKRFVGGIQKTAKEQLRFGLLGKDELKLREKMTGELSAEVDKAERLVKAATSTMKKYAKSVSQQDVIDFMTGKPVSGNMPIDLANDLTAMRSHIDVLTDRLIQLGVIDNPESIAYYQANKGQYLLRSYEAINYKDNPLSKFLYGEGLNIDNVANKLVNVDKTVVDTALEYLAQRAMKENPSLTKEEAIKQARIDANEILSTSEQYVMQKGLTGSVNVQSLSQRKDIAPEIRALMGEYTDPLYNYYSTIFKISGLTSSRQYINSLKEYGLNKFLFEKPTEDATEKIAADETKTLAPLNGLYTFPEIKEALQKSQKETGNILSDMAGRIRKFKTVYNPATHVKNIVGNMGFAISNGHWNYIGDAYKYIRAEIINNNDADAIKMMDTLNRYGVLNNVVGLGELKSYFKEHEDVDNFLQSIYDNANKKTTAYKLSKAKSKLDAIPKAIEKAYAIEDDVFKILGFVNESNRYANALYGKKYNQLNQGEKNKIDEIASEIVKDTYPTFSRVPKVVKTVSKYMFMGNFLSFPVESVRVQYNSLALARKEINSGNPKLKAIGATRLAGFAIYNSLFSTIAMYGYNLAGAGLTGMIGMISGDEKEEKETTKSIVRNVAPWNKNNDIYVSQFSNGKLVYYDIGSLDSYNYQKRVWNAFWSTSDREGFDNAIAPTIAAALDPWIQYDFVVDNFMKLRNNDNGNGFKIYNPEEKAIDRYKDMATFVGKQFGPGYIGASIKIAESYQKGDYDKMKDEFSSQVFARKYTVDLKKQFTNYLYAEGGTPEKQIGFKERLDNAERIYTDAKRQGVKGVELVSKYREAVDAYKNILSTARDYYLSAIDGGVRPSDLNMVVKKSRIGQAEFLAIVAGMQPPTDAIYIRR